ncbi:Predicted integral membrane protein [Mycobacteroides abscessus subsp. abscessus]|nr:Predicted integral membrane protein [Mycobacteroides abscessus subsp. abscessus]
MFFIRLLLLVIPIVYMALIWIQTSNFDPESVYMLSTHIDMKILLLIGAGLELAHLFEFGLLYLFLVMAFLVFGKLSHKKELLAVLIAFGYGVVDELHQYYIPFRSFSLVDLMKNGIGVWALWYFTRKKYHKNRSRFGNLLKRITHTQENHHNIKL